MVVVVAEVAVAMVVVVAMVFLMVVAKVKVAVVVMVVLAIFISTRPHHALPYFAMNCYILPDLALTFLDSHYFTRAMTQRLTLLTASYT